MTEAEKKRARAKTDGEGYLATIDSIEPNVHAIDAGAYHASVAISLKRIADSLERIEAMKAKESKSLFEEVFGSRHSS